MLDQRGGAFTLGLGLVRGMAVIPEAETWSEERLQRTLSLADTAVVELPTGSAVVGHDGALGARRLTVADGSRRAHRGHVSVISTVSTVTSRDGAPSSPPSSRIARATSSPSVIVPKTT